MKEADQRQERMTVPTGKIRETLPRFGSVIADSCGKGIYKPVIRLKETIGCWKQP